MKKQHPPHRRAFAARAGTRPAARTAARAAAVPFGAKNENRRAPAAPAPVPGVPPSRRIETHNEVADFNPSKKSVARLFGLLDSYPERRIPPGELSIAFLGDAAIQQLHQQFFDDPETTDVITFPGDSAATGGDSAAASDGESSAADAAGRGDAASRKVTQASCLCPPAAADVAASTEPPPAFAGEICVCVPQARREAGKHGNTVRDEILLYLIHGWLHLAGLDDHSDEDRIQMRAAEKHLLRWLSQRAFRPAWGE